MRERYADECAICKSIVYVEPSLVMTESFCGQCRIAIALENLVELVEEAVDAYEKTL